MASVKDCLTKAVRDASGHNPDSQIKPFCILWTDGDRQWEGAIARLIEEMPELLVLGECNPEKRTGPAIWLRCAIAGKIDGVALPDDRTPIIYLPGVSRQDMRDVKNCLEYIKSIVELQFRGALWSQANARDWTILAFLKSDQKGLGLEVSQDNDTKDAMLLALNRLLDLDVNKLIGKRLDRDFFNKLIAEDYVRTLLQWLNDDAGMRAALGRRKWKAFIDICRSELGFNPESEGSLKGVEKLTSREGVWLSVWNRFCEAPKDYPDIPDKIRKIKPPPVELFSNEATHGSWPQWNDAQEENLRKELSNLNSIAPHEARAKILSLEKTHGSRRRLVWARLGESALALALEHLAAAAEITATSIAVGGVEDMTASYISSGWRADDAVLKALARVDSSEDFNAIKTAIRAIYLPWIEDASRHLQDLSDKKDYPGGTIETCKSIAFQEGECVIFVDGLRFDAAKQLSEMLGGRGCIVEEQLVWAALPSVTSTGKAAASPVRRRIFGKEFDADFDPCVAETGQSLKGGYHLKKLLNAEGWKVLGESEDGDGNGNGWCEFGDIDHSGHEWGWKLARNLDGILREIVEKTAALLRRGWKNVRIVTDHGWLLLPGGLPKTELSSALTESKWGRCAVMKEGASTKERMFPWFWNRNFLFALADGVGDFRKGEEYAHGGLSLQECLLLELKVFPAAEKRGGLVEITDIVWKGMRCVIAVEGAAEGLSADIRKEAGNPASSVVASVRGLKEDGMASVVVVGDELEGSAAFIVLLDADGEITAQIETTIGGGKK